MLNPRHRNKYKEYNDKQICKFTLYIYNTRNDPNYVSIIQKLIFHKNANISSYYLYLPPLSFVFRNYVNTRYI